MGLLSKAEQDGLIDLLQVLPGVANPIGRDVLLRGVPMQLKLAIPVIGIPGIDIRNLVDTLESPIGQRGDGSWPISDVIVNAFDLLDRASALAVSMGELLDRARVRAGALRTEQLDLEAIVNKRTSFNAAEPWAARYLEVLRTVCVVESQTPGTGFLVGPNLVMTNHHVVELDLGDPAKMSAIVVRFDYRVGADGRALTERPYKLVPNAVLPWSPQNEFDFALLQLEHPAGDEPVGGIAGGTPRKWLRPSTRSLAAAMPLFVIQHADGRRLELAFDMIENVTPEYVRYRTNTELGSSGAPCFSERWELVALHQGFDPPLNRGIPFSRMLAQRADLRQALGM